LVIFDILLDNSFSFNPLLRVFTNVTR